MKKFSKEFLLVILLSILASFAYGAYIFFWGIPKTLSENYPKTEVCKNQNFLISIYCKNN